MMKYLGNRDVVGVIKPAIREVLLNSEGMIESEDRIALMTYN